MSSPPTPISTRTHSGLYKSDVHLDGDQKAMGKAAHSLDHQNYLARPCNLSARPSRHQREIHTGEPTNELPTPSPRHGRELIGRRSERQVSVQPSPPNASTYSPKSLSPSSSFTHRLLANRSSQRIANYARNRDYASVPESTTPMENTLKQQPRMTEFLTVYKESTRENLHASLAQDAAEYPPRRPQISLRERSAHDRQLFHRSCKDKLLSKNSARKISNMDLDDNSEAQEHAFEQMQNILDTTSRYPAARNTAVLEYGSLQDHDSQEYGWEEDGKQEDGQQNDGEQDNWLGFESDEVFPSDLSDSFYGDCQRTRPDPQELEYRGPVVIKACAKVKAAVGEMVHKTAWTSTETRKLHKAAKRTFDEIASQALNAALFASETVAAGVAKTKEPRRRAVNRVVRASIGGIFQVPGVRRSLNVASNALDESWPSLPIEDGWDLVEYVPEAYARSVVHDSPEPDEQGSTESLGGVFINGVSEDE